jgi:hypothetical protein
MKKAILIFFLFAAISAGFSQIRWDLGTPGSAGVVQVAGGAGYPPLYAVPGVSLAFCSYPAVISVPGGPCANVVATYTDLTLTTACPSNAQIVLQGTSTCVATGDANGNLGVNLASGGLYSYTLTVSGVTVGPYTVTLGTISGGGPYLPLAGNTSLTPITGQIYSNTNFTTSTITIPSITWTNGFSLTDASGDVFQTGTIAELPYIYIEAPLGGVVSIGDGDVDAGGDSVVASGGPSGQVLARSSGEILIANAIPEPYDHFTNALAMEESCSPYCWSLENNHGTTPTAGIRNTSGSVEYVFGDPIVLGQSRTSTSANSCTISSASGTQCTGPMSVGPLTTTASTTSVAGLNIPPGAAPTSPNNGDCWTTTAGLFCQSNGGTVAYASLRCETGLGDGLNAIPAGTYLQYMCMNDSRVTWTIAAIHCYTDNAGSSTLAATNNAATALLTGPVTCNNTKAGGGAAGTLGSTVTMAPGDAVNFTFISDGASKQTTWTVSLSQ